MKIVSTKDVKGKLTIARAAESAPGKGREQVRSADYGPSCFSLSRYWVGVSPVIFLKMVLKVDFELKPES